ncbi:hypothetical protein QQM39_02280 [Streptomyces sp. DT2A-34]|uniref:hypothetical protein n=1 Tax=Streptomyces sp. DT2A-34 TaxID=3051182 RepID=UPI00265C71C3|nr:hypothetical protein [Streptomyces sp. DT2A-34]MDO0909727.1 hypothetical protein [Streptomyces sp. DT2A-34]
MTAPDEPDPDADGQGHRPEPSRNADARPRTELATHRTTYHRSVRGLPAVAPIRSAARAVHRTT